MGGAFSTPDPDPSAPAISDPPPRKDSHTFRIQALDFSVTEPQLRAWLTELSKSASESGANIQALSLSPHNDTKTATVTFAQVPAEFKFEKSVLQKELLAKIGNGSECKHCEVLIDSKFIGITPLYCGANPEVDIVAVPGLGAHAFGTWKGRNGYKMWLRDFLPKDKAFEKARILLYGYRSDLKGNTSKDSIQDYARRLLMQLQHVRSKGEERERPIIFVCHCLGGLLVKKALSDAARSSSAADNAIFKSCIGLLFFGVPNRGLDNKNLLSLVREQNNNQLVRDLNISSPLLRVIHQDFAEGFNHICNRCRVVSFYEALDSCSVQELEGGVWEKSGPLIRLVTMESATYAVPKEAFHDQISLDADHSEMVKYDNPFEERYIAVLTRLRECVQRVPEFMGAGPKGVILAECNLNQVE